MLYASVAEFSASVPEHLLTQLTGGDESPDTVALGRALEDASAEMDGYLGSRYPLPLPTVPESLRRICIDIALYRLMNLRALGDIEDSRQRYDDAIRYLKDLVRGAVTLGLPENSPAPASGIAFVAGSSIMKGLDY